MARDNDQPKAPDNRPQWPQTLVQFGRHFCWESDLRHYQAELIALALGQNPPAKPPKPEDDKLVPIRVAAERFGLSRRTVGRRIRPQQRPAPPSPPQATAAE